jgi:hypothetical protein
MLFLLLSLVWANDDDDSWIHQAKRELAGAAKASGDLDSLARALADMSPDEKKAMASLMGDLTASSDDLREAMERKSQMEDTYRAESKAALATATEKTLAARNAPGYVAAAQRMMSLNTNDQPQDMLSRMTPVVWRACDPTDKEWPLDQRYAKCAELYFRALETKPGDWRLHYAWTAANIAMGNEAAAFLGAVAVTELQPIDSYAAYRAGSFGISVGELPAGANFIARGASLDLQPELVAGAALKLARVNGLPIAIQLLDHSLKIAPQDGLLLGTQCYLMAGGGRTDLALPVCERAGAAGFDGAEMFLAWGLSLHAAGKTDAGVQKLREAVKRAPGALQDIPPELRSKL